MNASGFVFRLLAALLQITAPRRWAPLPLLLSVLDMTRGQVRNVAGANLAVLQFVRDRVAAHAELQCTP